jgi:hypothetical protein
MVANCPDASEQQWRMGKVCVLKNESCDIQVPSPDGYEYRHDVFHVNDMRCVETREWSDPLRGVFKLSAREKNLQDFIDRRLPLLEAKLARIESMIEKRQLQR